MCSLMITGKYSDLMIECQGVEWRVHKAIVCMRSVVMAKMVESGMKVQLY